MLLKRLCALFFILFASPLYANVWDYLPLESVWLHLSQTGIVVLCVLLILVVASISTWAVFFAKWLSLWRIERNNAKFIESFWDSRSLNDLNKRLDEFSPSPTREIFRVGYAELARANQVKQGSLSLTVAIDNIGRSLGKTKIIERRSMESLISLLAIGASACPFIGLFGTVWGIMGAFDGIATTGDASLAAVAPGISEALIATAFGLAAAIPAAVGYNLIVNKIRGVLTNTEGFCSDFLNIVERYLVSSMSPTVASESTPTNNDT